MKYQLKGTSHQHHPTPGSPPSGSTPRRSRVLALTAAEAAYLNSVRGHYPGGNATLLGRDTCNMLGGGVTTGYVVPDIAAHLGIGNAAADQVLDAAMDYICPDIHIGANGADDSRPYH